MTKRGHDSEETRSALLEAAAEVFAEKGFQGATTREIAGRAGANLASIHYHFRDKEGIYKAVIGAHIERLKKAVPLKVEFPAGTPPEERLTQIVDSILRRAVHGGDAGEWSIFIHELATPTGTALDFILDNIIRTHFKAMFSTVAELLGPKANEEDVRHCSFSVISQIVFNRFARPIIAAVAPSQHYDEGSVAKLSAHIAKFSLDAIKARREEIARRRPEK